MSEQHVAPFLKELRRLMRQVTLYPEGHPLTANAVLTAQRATEDFLGGREETVLTIHGDAFFQDRVVVPHASLEYQGLLREVQSRGVESITLSHPASTADLYDLASFLAGVSDDLPADGTVRLNEPTLGEPDFEVTQASQMRASYGATLDAVRLVSGAMTARGSFELSTVINAVEGLFEHTVAQPGAALLLSTVKSHDEYTFYHSVNVCILSLAIGQMVGVEKEKLIPVGVGAVLHDIGKVSVSPATLNYPGRLAEEQWKEITLHPQEGALAIMSAGGPGNEIAATVAFEHHARFDGKGYPTVSRSRRPHIYSRLVSVVDVYDAITTRRAYRRAESPNRALQVLLGGADSHWDAELVRTFIRMMGIFPPGSILLLDTGEVAVVVAAPDDEGAPLPAMMVKDSSGGEIEPEPTTIPAGRVSRQVLPEDVGVDPAALLEQVVDEEPQADAG